MADVIDPTSEAPRARRPPPPPPDSPDDRSPPLPPPPPGGPPPTRKRSRSAPSSLPPPPPLGSSRPERYRDHHYRGGRGGSSPSPPPYRGGRRHSPPRRSPSPPFKRSRRDDGYDRRGDRGRLPQRRIVVVIVDRFSEDLDLDLGLDFLIHGSSLPRHGHDDRRYWYDYERGGGRGWYDDDRYHGRYQNRAPDRSNSGFGVANDGPGVTQREGLMTYEQFNPVLKDDISPAEADSRYQEYMTQYITTQKRSYFELNKYEDWFKDKYHPTKDKIDAAVAELLEPYVGKIRDEKYGWKYGCGAKGCTKLFHAPEFVHKHFWLKHPELVLESTSKVREDLYFQNYMNDPNAPGGKPVMQQSAPNGNAAEAPGAEQENPAAATANGHDSLS